MDKFSEATTSEHQFKQNTNKADLLPLTPMHKLGPKHLQEIPGFTDLENKLMVARREEWEKEIVWDRYVHTSIFKMDNQQGPIVYHRELCCYVVAWMEGSLGKNGYTCMYG